jgi:hypothetical protein
MGFKLLRRKKISLPDVTMVCITGVFIKKHIYALWRSSRRIEFKEIKLITSQKISYVPKWISVEKAIDNPLSSIDYFSHYCVYSLHKHIKSNYVLIIHADGYIVNSHKWNDIFLNFDYIGAPWKIRSDAYIDPFGNHQRVGNGGFSLRSKKLLELPLTENIEWNINQGNFYRHMGVGEQAEDGIICVHNRHVYEAAGCKFAPLEIALNFSREQNIPENMKLDTFGFHKKIYNKKLMAIDLCNRVIFNILYFTKKL